jgi:5-methylthioadenosine/S-adenosylhomocysteine deaminase
MSERLLLRGGCVLTLDPKAGNLPQGDVLVENGRVAEIGPVIRARDAEIIDAADTIVMPGFVDCHRHVWESLFRHLGDAASPADYGPHYRPDDVYAATLLGLLGAAEAGITTVVDWSEFGGDHADAALQAHADSGLRTVFVLAPSPWSAGDTRAELHRLARANLPDSTSLAAAPAPANADPEEVARGWAVARDLGLRIHAHAGHQASDSGTITSLADRDLLADDVTLVHCSSLGDADLDAIAAAGVQVCLTPSAEMAAGLTPPIQRLIDRGIRPGLGVDRERMAPGDLFAQMRQVISLQHAHSFDLKLAGKAGLPKLMTTRDAIRHATGDSARAAGLGGVTGSLEPGKAADLIVLRTDRPNIWPVNDPIGAVVWGMDTSNLDWVFVGGRAIMREGALTGDVARARELASQAQARVIEAAGALASAVGGGGA